jgi:predicted nucleotidyltransferase component of viral defense system
LREYLQYKILSSIFSHPFSQKLCFIWWTALRIWYNSQRFSEDLDFDNWWLTESEFELLTEIIQKDLIADGYEVEIRHTYKWAFHCAIKIPQILFDNNLAPMTNEKLTIKIDTISQWYDYHPETAVLQWFDIVSPYRLVSKDILFAMKLSALFGRVKGRDLFDIVYLINLWAKPHLWFCDFALQLNSGDDIKNAIIERISTFDLIALQRDVQPFLFDSNNQSVVLFPRIIEQANFL